MTEAEKEFDEFSGKSADEIQKKFDETLKRAEELVKKNEELIQKSEQMKKENPPKNAQPAVTQPDFTEGQIMDWALETAFNLSGGKPMINMRTLTLAELFKTIYIAGMRGD